ncbi:Fe-S cluster assembly protein SufB, partial [Candidatus Gottesmanbacteria bacterium]|nr:Fe-S cluster assembly protein SufB [Candidatus Gottesmanbacteria bacterium]
MLAISCGLHATGIHEFTHYADIKKKVGTKIGYRLQISGDLSQLTIYSQKVSDGFVPRAYYHKYSSHHKSPITKHISEHIGFAPISEISHSGEEDVYDIEVEGHHNFIANGIIVHNSEVVYKSVQKALSAKGVIFLDMDSGLREHPDIVKKYFGTIIPPNDNKFDALNSAVWSGGSFIYVPPGVHVDLPLQAYFRINAANMGQFERTLIIADEGSYVHYVEGCLPAGEQVSLGDRWANIESLKPGDLVADEDGELRRVKAVMTRPYKGELIEITPISSYNAFQLTPEHPVLAIKRQDALAKRNKRGTWQREVSTRKLLLEKPTYLPVNKLDVGDFIVYPQVKSTKKEKFSVQLLRLLGYYLAEGSAYIHNQLKVAVVGFSLSEKETNLIAEIKQLIFDVTGKKAMFIHDKKRHGIEIRVYSKELYDRCLLECGKGAATKQLSKTLMSLPAEQIQPLLTTYFLGDGNVCKKGNSTMCRAATTSESLARQLQELLGRLGVYASIQRRKGGIDWIKGRQISRRDQFIIVYTKNKTMGEVRSNQGHFLVPIKKVKRVPYDGFVFNMEVDKTNSYLI